MCWGRKEMDKSPGHSFHHSPSPGPAGTQSWPFTGQIFPEQLLCGRHRPMAGPWEESVQKTDTAPALPDFLSSSLLAWETSLPALIFTQVEEICRTVTHH